jgi:pilus assembly protein CpaB
VLEIVEIPKKFIQPEALDNIELAIDRVVSVPLLKGTQVLGSMLVTNRGANLSKKIPKDKLAMSVSVNNVSGIAGLLQPGDFVDIMLTVEVEELAKTEQPANNFPMMSTGSARAITEIITKNVLQNIQVLAVDQRVHRSRAVSNAAAASGPGNILKSLRSTSRGKANEIATVTLLLDNKQIAPMTLAQEIGSISLVLRSEWQDENPKILEDSLQLGSKDFLGLDKTIVPRQPAWMEIRGAKRVGRF